jgi:nitrogen fixation/metabolism regulation signal transduction histidine kinase
MATKTLRRRANTILVAFALLLALLAIFLLSQTTQQSEEFGRLQGTILAANFIAAAVLFGLILANLVRLIRELRNHESGARLKARMVYAFVGLAILPILLVYFFSVKFLNQGIETWFDVKVEKGLGDALELSRSALDFSMTEELSRTQLIAQYLPPRFDPRLFDVLSGLRADSGAIELTVFGDNLSVYAFSSIKTDSYNPEIPDDEMLSQLRRKGHGVRLEPNSDGGYQVRTLVAMPTMLAGINIYMLQGVFPVGEELGPLANSVQQTYARYRELLFLRAPLKQTVVLTLSLVVLLSVLTAVYGAFFFARRLVSPLETLVAGTRAVAEGDLDTRLPQGSSDEIGFLVSAFNNMTESLGAARAEARFNEFQAEIERANLEAVLGGLTTGVIVLNPDSTLRQANNAACDIVGVDLTSEAGAKLTDIYPSQGFLESFAREVGRHMLEQGSTWREQIELKSDKGRRVIICSSAGLADTMSSNMGLVVVFDDITELLQAQRNAAWGEVARRLAHEIKNPLTPIQLSAERIRRKFLADETGEKAEVLDLATHTIVQQVEAMRDMVNAFSEYARSPQINISSVFINQLILQVVDLYPSLPGKPVLSTKLDRTLENIDIDGIRIRQVLHNLIRNSIEALESTDSPFIQIVSKFISDDKEGHVEITVIDNGPGIPEGELEKIFEPYMTTKTKGTGLGLAIVKKLIDEHGGDVSAQNHMESSLGAIVRIVLPVVSAIKSLETSKVDSVKFDSKMPERWSKSE